MQRKYGEYNFQSLSGSQATPKFIKEFASQMSNKILDLQRSGIEVVDIVKGTVKEKEVELNSLKCELQGQSVSFEEEKIIFDLIFNICSNYYFRL